jgi:hypothetical protein
MTNQFITLLVIISCASLAACKPQAVQPPAPPAAVTVTDDLRTKLAFADTADGKTDHIVEKCVTCRLQMTGKSQFTVPVGDYSVHLCSADCQNRFAADPAKALLALQP